MYLPSNGFVPVLLPRLVYDSGRQIGREAQTNVSGIIPSAHVLSRDPSNSKDAIKRWMAPQISLIGFLIVCLITEDASNLRVKPSTRLNVSLHGI